MLTGLGHTKTEAMMLAALALAAAIFWHIQHRPAQGAAPSQSTPPPATDTVAGGLPILRLGQYAVAPDRQWLLIPRGY